jgi:hypothetical protein
MSWPWGLIPTGKSCKRLKERFPRFFRSVIALNPGGPEKRSMRVFWQPSRYERKKVRKGVKKKRFQANQSALGVTPFSLNHESTKRGG